RGFPAGTGVGATDYFTAVTRASKCPERDFPNRTTNGLFYLVDTKTKKVLAGPDETRRYLAQRARNKGIKLAPTQKVLEIKHGTIVVRAQSPDDKTQS